MSAVADRRTLSLTPGRCVRTRVAGLFLFLPLLGCVQFDQLVSKADYPGSKRIPATSALLSLLALKLLDKERRSHNPILREAALDQSNQKIPWLQNLPLIFQYP
jgi:hypothetical protein